MRHEQVFGSPRARLAQAGAAGGRVDNARYMRSSPEEGGAAVQLLPPLQTPHEFMLEQHGVARRDPSGELRPSPFWYHPLAAAKMLGLNDYDTDGVARLDQVFGLGKARQVNHISGTTMYREKQGEWHENYDRKGHQFWIYVHDPRVSREELDSPPPVSLKVQKALARKFLLPDNGPLLSALLEGDLFEAMLLERDTKLCESISNSDEMRILLDIPEGVGFPSNGFMEAVSGAVKGMLDVVLRPMHREVYGCALESHRPVLDVPVRVAPAAPSIEPAISEAEAAAGAVVALFCLVQQGLDAYCARIRAKPFRKTSACKVADVDFEAEWRALWGSTSVPGVLQLVLDSCAGRLSDEDMSARWLHVFTTKMAPAEPESAPAAGPDEPEPEPVADGVDYDGCATGAMTAAYEYAMEAVMILRPDFDADKRSPRPPGMRALCTLIDSAPKDDVLAVLHSMRQAPTRAAIAYTRDAIDMEHVEHRTAETKRFLAGYVSDIVAATCDNHDERSGSNLHMSAANDGHYCSSELQVDDSHHGLSFGPDFQNVEQARLALEDAQLRTAVGDWRASEPELNEAAELFETLMVQKTADNAATATVQAYMAAGLFEEATVDGDLSDEIGLPPLAAMTAQLASVSDPPSKTLIVPLKMTDQVMSNAEDIMWWIDDRLAEFKIGTEGHPKVMTLNVDDGIFRRIMHALQLEREAVRTGKPAGRLLKHVVITNGERNIRIPFSYFSLLR